jgi:hypothetical protein
VSTSSRDETLKQKSASECVVGSAIGSFENSANLSRLSSMTIACSPTPMLAAVSSSVNLGSKLNPSLVKNALLRWRSATGMFTTSMRPACAGVVMASPVGGSMAYAVVDPHSRRNSSVELRIASSDAVWAIGEVGDPAARRAYALRASTSTRDEWATNTPSASICSCSARSRSRWRSTLKPGTHQTSLRSR